MWFCFCYNGLSRGEKVSLLSPCSWETGTQEGQPPHLLCHVLFPACPPGALGAADPPLSSPALLLSLRGLPRDPPVLHIHFPSPLDLLTALQTYCFISPFRNQILCPLFLLYGACLSLFPLKQSSLKDLSGLPSPLPLSHSVSLAIRLSFPQLPEDAGSSRGFLVTSNWKIQEQPPAPSPSIRGKHS